MNTVLDQTADERRAHLKDANRIRMARAALKLDIAAMSCSDGRAYLVARIEDWDPLALSFRLREAICAVRSYGPHISRRHAERMGCSQDDRLIGLSDAQLATFVDLLRTPKAIMPGSSKAAL